MKMADSQDEAVGCQRIALSTPVMMAVIGKDRSCSLTVNENNSKTVMLVLKTNPREYMSVLRLSQNPKETAKAVPMRVPS